MNRARNAGKIQKPRSERGYALLYLLLMMALLAIAAAIAAPDIAFEIRRDREEELIHRGVQYSRAIRSYAKKTGHYPANLDQLRDTSGMRFIRKLYKDPVTGGDFRLLHQGDVISLTSPPALNAPANENGDNGNSTGQAAPSDPNSATAVQNASTTTPASPTGPASPTTTNSGNGLFAQSGGGNFSQGGVIFGVASKSKKKSIREFDHKNHYNDWLFFFDPARDRGFEIKGPTSLSAFPSPQGSAAPNSNQPAPVQQQ